MDGWEAKRRENVKRNAALVQSLGLDNHDLEPEPQRSKTAPAKRRKLETGQPTRSSARIAQVAEKPTTYNEDALGGASLDDGAGGSRKSRGGGIKALRGRPPKPASPAPAPSRAAHPELESIRSGWTSWEAVAPAPTRDAAGVYHFESHPEFQPNKSPEEIMREGCFGGSYWRPLYSRYLKTTVEDDWRELPAAWTEGLDIERYLTSPEYDAEVNKYGVACGQSIEEWEAPKASGWIAHDHDVRGWFQWYCRFWMGRRCADDERQVSRWKKCVGETGRWRRTLLKKYVQMGIRSVFDDGDEADERGDVSPVVHQTCHHWAYEVRQEALDRYWAEGT